MNAETLTAVPPNCGSDKSPGGEECGPEDAETLSHRLPKPTRRARKSAAQRRVERKEKTGLSDSKKRDHAVRIGSMPDQDLLHELKTWDDVISSFGDSDPTLTGRAAACAVIVRRELDGRR